jgi:SAM-dependent methyltransferase
MSIAHRVSSWNRTRKWRRFIDDFRPAPSTTILDVGYSDLEHQSADNFLEQHYRWPAQITALGVEEPAHFSQRYPEVHVVVYDGGRWPFADQAFDVVWSNAVLEHVGDRRAQVDFLREALRVGRRVHLTTPNRGFPIEVHSRLPFVHWLPRRTLDTFMRLAGKPQFTDGYMRLLTGLELRRLLRAAGYRMQDTTIIRNRFFGPVMDFVVVTRARS